MLFLVNSFTADRDSVEDDPRIIFSVTCVLNNEVKNILWFDASNKFVPRNHYELSEFIGGLDYDLDTVEYIGSYHLTEESFRSKYNDHIEGP